MSLNTRGEFYDRTLPKLVPLEVKLSIMLFSFPNAGERRFWDKFAGTLAPYFLNWQARRNARFLKGIQGIAHEKEEKE